MSMKANELRIGNWINIYDDYNSEVTGFTEDGDVWFVKNPTDIKCAWNISRIKPIPLTEEWLVKFGFENWGLGTQWNNQYESYVRYVLHNVLDGTSNFEVHYIKSTYGDTEHYQYIIACDEDDRINWGEDIKHVHQLQNLYFALTGEELHLTKD